VAVKDKVDPTIGPAVNKEVLMALCSVTLLVVPDWSTGSTAKAGLGVDSNGKPVIVVLAIETPK
jgi:hypothetical protein